MNQKQHPTTQTPSDAAPSSHFETVTLKGGVFDGQKMRIPRDEFFIQLSDRGRPVAYSRFNSSPTLHHEDAIVRVLGGAKR